MKDADQTIGLYEIFKDIVIPSISITVTIVIGVIIAIIIINKEEKAKKKELLIDSYMEYLSVWTKNFAEDSLMMTFQIYKKISLNYGDFFKEHSNTHIMLERIEIRLKKHKTRTDETIGTEHWSPFTYKFAFLLGKDTYDKNLQALEDKIVLYYSSGESINGLENQILNKIQKSKEVTENLFETNIKNNDHALDLIDKIIVDEFNTFLSGLFVNYNNKLANLINDL